MDKKTDNKNVEDKDIDKMKQLEEMRKELARNMGVSNYFFYLDSNINSKTSRGI